MERKVLAAWAQNASGPGWSNQLIWYVWWDGARHHVDALQPEEQSPELMLLFSTSAALNVELVGEVEKVLREKS
jgi:hypothetical protein